jgi:hypothetical protein
VTQVGNHNSIKLLGSMSKPIVERCRQNLFRHWKNMEPCLGQLLCSRKIIIWNKIKWERFRLEKASNDLQWFKQRNYLCFFK